MTLSKLAKLANVSLSTVSKAFSGSDEISAETRNMIFNMAKRHGCFEKYYKGKYAKKAIAVICPEVQSEYYAAFATCMEELIRQRNGTMLLSLTNFDMQAELDIINYYRCFAKVDGIIANATLDYVRTAEGIPTVGVLAHDRKRDDMDCIYIDYDNAIYEAIAYLVENGHRKIAFIGETLTYKKKQGFLTFMERHKLCVPDAYVVTEEKRFEAAGHDAMAKLMALADPPTAVIAAYDYMALGAMACINENGKSVPDDFSIIGMDDIGAVSNYNISLTSVKTDVREVCETAVEYLFEKIQHPTILRTKSVVVRSELVKRGSVRHI